MTSHSVNDNLSPGHLLIDLDCIVKCENQRIGDWITQMKLCLNCRYVFHLLNMHFIYLKNQYIFLSSTSLQL